MRLYFVLAALCCFTVSTFAGANTHTLIEVLNRTDMKDGAYMAAVLVTKSPRELSDLRI